VKALRKPSVVAAEVNRVVRADPAGVNLILQAAGLLRDAQQGTLDGSTIDAAQLQVQYRAAIQALAQTASTKHDEVKAAIEAAAIDLASNDDLRIGALAAVPIPPSLFGMAPPAETPAAPSEPIEQTVEEPDHAAEAEVIAEDELASRRAKREQQARDKAEAAAAKAQAKADKEAAAEAAKQAKAEREAEKLRKKERQQKRKALAKEHREAVRAHLDALDAQAEASTAIDDAEAALAQAEQDVETARAALAEAEQELPAATKAIEAAQQTHDELRQGSNRAEALVAELAAALDKLETDKD